MKIIAKFVAIASLLLLGLAGLLHGASLAGMAAGILVDGTSVISIIENFCKRNLTDPLFGASVVFVGGYFLVFGAKLRQSERAFLLPLSNRTHFALSALIYLVATIACACAAFVAW